jgi:hypothetical protein
MDDTIGAGAPAAFNPEVHAGSPVEPTDETSLLFQVVIIRFATSENGIQKHCF